MRNQILFLLASALSVPALLPTSANAYDWIDSDLCNDSQLGSYHADDRDVDIDFNFASVDNDDLVIRVDNEVALVITPDYDVTFYGQELELTDKGRELASDYYHSMDGFIYDASSIAGDAARIGADAVGLALRAILTDIDESEIEDRIERKAEEIEASAERLCTRFTAIHDIERAMQREIKGFEPVLFPNKDISL